MSEQLSRAVSELAAAYGSWIWKVRPHQAPATTLRITTSASSERRGGAPVSVVEYHGGENLHVDVEGLPLCGIPHRHLQKDGEEPQCPWWSITAGKTST